MTYRNQLDPSILIQGCRPHDLRAGKRFVVRILRDPLVGGRRGALPSPRLSRACHLDWAGCVLCPSLGHSTNPLWSTFLLAVASKQRWDRRRLDVFTEDKNRSLCEPVPCPRLSAVSMGAERAFIAQP